MKVAQCPVCHLPPAETLADRGMIQVIYYVCPEGHHWQETKTEEE